MRPPATPHHACLTTGPQARTVRQARACPGQVSGETVTGPARNPGR